MGNLDSKCCKNCKSFQHISNTKKHHNIMLQKKNDVSNSNIAYNSILKQVVDNVKFEQLTKCDSNDKSTITVQQSVNDSPDIVIIDDYIKSLNNP